MRESWRDGRTTLRSLHGRARLLGNPHFHQPKGKAMNTQLLGALLALSITAPAFAAIKETPVTYNDGQTTMKGFVGGFCRYTFMPGMAVSLGRSSRMIWSTFLSRR